MTRKKQVKGIAKIVSTLKVDYLHFINSKVVTCVADPKT